MGVIQSGILSGVSGKVAGVVGGRWKDKYYIRAWVKPANPDTAAQQVQRTKFSDVVAFAKPLVGQVFNAYTDRFQKAMSGFNFFIKRNIDVFDGSPILINVKLTEGPLSRILVTNTAYSNDLVSITFSKNLGNNGSDSDKVFSAVYHEPTGIWYFASAEVDRSAEFISVTVPTGLTAADLFAFTWAAKYVGTTVDMISPDWSEEAS